MADFNENKDGVFGGVQFNGNDETGNTAYFEGTIGNEQTENTGSNNDSVFGSFKQPTSEANTGTETTNGAFGTIGYDTIEKDKAITKQSLWSKIRAFLFQEIDLNAPIKVELTPYQQKVEDEINEFLHQDVSFKNIAKLFKKSK